MLLMVVGGGLVSIVSGIKLGIFVILILVMCSYLK